MNEFEIMKAIDALDAAARTRVLAWLRAREATSTLPMAYPVVAPFMPPPMPAVFEQTICKEWYQ